MLSKVAIRWKLLIPIFLIFITLFFGRQIVIHRNIETGLAADLELQLKQSNDNIHKLVESLIAHSLKNYLWGRVEDAAYSFEAVFNAYKRGAIPLSTAMKNLEQGMLNRQVGDSGYFFVMDTDGTVIFHPVEEYIGENFSQYDFFREQLKVRNGYREYVWQNPGESVPREKAMYTSYFEPMDWIIVITAYKNEFSDIIEFSDLEENIPHNNKIGEFFFIIDSTGKILLHPFLSNESIYDYPEYDFFNSIIFDHNTSGNMDGVIDYTFQSPVTGDEEEHRLYYSWISDFDWIIASSISINDFYQPIRDIDSFLFIFDTMLFLLLTGFVTVFSHIILKPITNFTKSLLESEMLNSIPILRRGDEVQIAKQVFQFYIELISREKSHLKKAVEENQMLANFPEKLQLPVIRIDSDNRCCFMNERAKNDLFPFQIGQNLGSIWEDYSEQIEMFAENKPVEVRLMGKLYTAHVTEIPESQEKYIHFYDRTSEIRLTTLQSIWHNVFDSSIEGITITDQTGVVERINASFTYITGYTESDILGKHTRLLKSDKHEDSFYSDMWKSLLESGHWEGKIWNRKKSGEIYLEWLSISAFIDNRTEQKKYMAIFHDISELYEKDRELNFLASHDILTKLPNRTVFHDRLSQVISSSKRNDESCAVIIIDIYGFNRINENLGMVFGDKFLVQISELLKECLRDEDTVARLGSDNFGLLLPRLTRDSQSVEIITRIQQMLGEPVTIDNHQLIPDINMGISLFPNDGATAEELINNANIALKRAKMTKPGMYSFFDSTYDTEFSNRFELEEALKMAVSRNEFVLQYQPKVRFDSGELAGFEALIRWNRDSSGYVSPGLFIPILEENGNIIEVGMWIIEAVCKYIGQVSTVFSSPFRIGINISARQFFDPGFISIMDSITEKYAVDPHHIDLEITENIAAQDLIRIRDILEQLQHRGFTISIDDFGTGYSSLKYLKDLQFTTLKIDKSFVDPLPGDHVSLAIIKSIIDLAKNLDKEIVVEGVETAQQAQLFKNLECDIMQGYFFSKPLSEEDALELAKKMNTDVEPIE